MEYANLGRTVFKVSRLGLGTMNFGPQTDQKTSHSIMDYALNSGINFFDTANVYGWKIGEGITEQIIGRCMEKWAKDRMIVDCRHITSVKPARIVYEGCKLII
jgi:NDP-hexose 2,3-enoyl reductase